MQGSQTPRIYSAPRYVSTSGDEAVELAAMVGLHLDPWQVLVLRDALGERPDGNWSAASVGVVCPRQNGKNAILEARELAGLFLLGERLIVHTAHQYDTSMEAYNRLKFLIENSPELDRRVKRYNNAHGTEGIELRGGQRIRFRTRTKGGGRGFSGDCVIFDEAMEFPQASLNAILPIISAQSVSGNPQVWYTGSAVDQFIHLNGEVLARIRARGVKGDDDRLAYFEWSYDAENPELLEEAEALSEGAWAVANPALGRRISSEYVRGEYVELGLRGFAVERLGVGDWPNLDGGDAVIAADVWAALADGRSRMNDPICFGVGVRHDRSASSIGVAGYRPDGKLHVEVVARERGTGWVPARLAELVSKHRPKSAACNAVGPVSSLIPDLFDAGVEIVTLDAGEYAAACGLFYDAAMQDRLRHLGSGELSAAVRSATKRKLGERWAWDGSVSGGDISSLEACTIALWKLVEEKPPAVPRLIDLSASDDDE